MDSINLNQIFTSFSNLIENMIKNHFGLFIVLFVFFCFLFLFIGRLIGKLESEKRIKKERIDAVKRSKAVVSGQVCEQVAPFFPDFPCLPSQVQFLGKPIDFIGFCGNEETGIVDEILFIEVKTGNSVLSAREKSVKKTIEAGKIRYVEYRPPLK